MTAAADEVVIWQAEGVVMQQQGCSAGEARVRLQALARSVEVSLAILCLAVVRDLEKEMKRLSRELSFEEAARVRDRIIAMRKRLAGEPAGEDDQDVAMALAMAPKTRVQVKNWRRGRKGP